jgi:RNA polymerase sigma-70 factor (ECF subfamily)
MRVLENVVEAPPRQNQRQAKPALVITPEEQLLLQRVTLHDEEAFDALYARYAPRLQSYLSRRLGRHELIDDVFQEVMLVLWQHAAKVPRTVPLVAWLCGVARHKTLKALAYASASPVSQATDENIDADNPEIGLLRQEDGDTLARVLDALPHGERMAIQLVLSQGWSYQEIAAVTGDPVSTIRPRVWRACQRLRTLIVALESHAS